MIRSTPTLVTAPATEPVTSAEAKAWMKVDSTDDDTLIGNLITAAREAAEKYTRRAFITQTWKLTVDLGGNSLDMALPDGLYELPVSALYGEIPREISLPYQPLQSITSVVSYSTSNVSSTYASTNYFADTANSRIVLNDGSVWPSDMRRKAGLVITYVSGYGTLASTVPQSIKHAIMMHIQKMYDERIVCDMPESCANLLRQYRIYG